jgi:amidase
MHELLRHGAIELGDMVRRGEVSARELVHASLDAISGLDHHLGAFTFVDAEGALEQASQVRPGDKRPFAGVPIAIKDIAPVAGMPLTGASDLYGDYQPANDSYTVSRLRRAGFIMVGKTNLSEFGVVPGAEPRRGSITRNPWDVTRSPGGSSGGSAAAVAAGMVPLAHGNDGGGSIRVPAACCGLVGLKPARGRVSRGPEVGEDFFVQDGVLTRSVADTAALLDVLAGPEAGVSTWLAPPPRPFSSILAERQAPKWIALATSGPLEGERDGEATAAVQKAGRVLRELGHEVFEFEPDWGSEFPKLLGRTLGPRLAHSMIEAGRVTGREPSADLLEPLSWRIYSEVKETSTADYLAASAKLQRLARRFIQEWDFDLLLLPTIGRRPLSIGALDCSASDLSQTLRQARDLTRFTSFFNATGQPAISLPLSVGEDGLPTAVQLVGPPAGEAVLLGVASQLEQALPWAARYPTQASPGPLAAQRSDETKSLSS